MRPVVALSLMALLGLAICAEDKKASLVPSQEQQVSTLVNSVQNDLKSDKRAEAAEVLHQFDGTQFPEIAPVLIQVLERDSDPHVRKEAARSLGKLQPTSAEAYAALAHAAEKDPALKVRMAARMAKLGYKAPPAPPTSPLPQPPREKWSEKFAFWKKKTGASPSEMPPPPAIKPPTITALPKPPKGEEAPLLLPSPPPDSK